MQTATGKPLYRHRWWMPAFSLFLGALMLVAFWIGDDITQGLVSFGIMAALVLLPDDGASSGRRGADRPHGRS